MRRFGARCRLRGALEALRRALVSPRATNGGVRVGDVEVFVRHQRRAPAAEHRADARVRDRRRGMLQAGAAAGMIRRRTARKTSKLRRKASKLRVKASKLRAKPSKLRVKASKLRGKPSKLRVK